MYRDVSGPKHASASAMPAWNRFCTPVKAAHVSNPHLIRVVTYNILANKYALGGYHNYCAPKYLDWSYRKNKIQEEIASYDSDVLCLQEVEQNVFNDELKPWMESKGYTGWYYPRQFGELYGTPEGLALFVRLGVFKPITTQKTTFSNCPFPPVTSRASLIGNSFWSVFGSKEEGAILALLEHVPTKQRMVAACTHLFWNPQYPDVKVAQAVVLCQQIAQFMTSHAGHSNLPLILGGDFNSLWRKYKPDAFDKTLTGPYLTSGVYQLLDEGCLSPEHPDHPYRRRRAGENVNLDFQGVALDNAGLQLKSMYMLAHGREPVLTTKTASFAGSLDYIWLSSQHWDVCETLAMPFEDSADCTDPMRVPFGPIPDETFPSDHLAMGCLLQLSAAATATASATDSFAAQQPVNVPS